MENYERRLMYPELFKVWRMSQFSYNHMRIRANEIEVPVMAENSRRYTIETLGLDGVQ